MKYHPVKYWSYLEAYAASRSEILAIVDRVFSSGRLILGESVTELERGLAAYCGTGFGIGVNSGTDALFLALKALGVGAGDEVLTVANTAVPTVAAITATGATPVLVDIDADTFLMDVRELAARLSSRTRAILPVHLYGQMVPMAPVLELARAHSLFVLEDCAQATGAMQRGRKAGSYGDCAAFSFYPTKILGGFGDAGMVLTRSPTLAEKLRRLRFYGIVRDYCAEEDGYNSRLDEVHAALLAHKMTSLDESIARRRHIAALYEQGLSGVGDILPPRTAAGNVHTYYVYTVRTQRRDALREFLARHEIGSQINYPTPIHRMPAYASLGYCPGDLPVTERVSDEILSLPMYPELTDADVDQVLICIRAFFAGM